MDIGITPTKWDDSIHKIMANFSYLTCPKCKGMRLKSWAEGEPCPKCGGEIDKGFLSVMWD
jgi:PHP family Zn ribbon phosphoesterase